MTNLIFLFSIFLNFILDISGLDWLFLVQGVKLIKGLVCLSLLNLGKSYTLYITIRNKFKKRPGSDGNRGPGCILTYSILDQSPSPPR